MPTMVISSALDAQARADIDSRPWYVVTYRDRDVVSGQGRVVFLSRVASFEAMECACRRMPKARPT